MNYSEMIKYLLIMISFLSCGVKTSQQEDQPPRLSIDEAQESSYVLSKQYFDKFLGLSFDYLIEERCGGCWVNKKIRIYNDSLSEELKFQDDYFLWKTRGGGVPSKLLFANEFNSKIRKFDLDYLKIQKVIYVIFHKLLELEYVQPSDKSFILNNAVNTIRYADQAEKVLYKSLVQDLDSFAKEIETRGRVNLAEGHTKVGSYDIYNLYNYQTFIKISYFKDSISLDGLYPKYYDLIMY